MRFTVLRGLVQKELLLPEHITKTSLTFIRVCWSSGEFVVFTALRKHVIQRHWGLEAFEWSLLFLSVFFCPFVCVSDCSLPYWWTNYVSGLLTRYCTIRSAKVPFRFMVNARKAGSKLIHFIITLIIFNSRLCACSLRFVASCFIHRAGERGEAINLELCAGFVPVVDHLCRTGWWIVLFLHINTGLVEQ